MPAVDLTARLALESKATDKDTILFDKGVVRLRAAHPPVRRQGLRRPDARSGRAEQAEQAEADNGRPPPGAQRRAGAPAGRTHHRAGQGRGGPGSPSASRRSTQAARRWPTWPTAISKSMSLSAASRRPSGRPAASSTATSCRPLGKLPIAAVERRHVMALHESLCETPAMANMTVETLSHMYALARGWDMAPEDCDDPCEFIPMNPKRKRERFLTDAEFHPPRAHARRSLGQGQPDIRPARLRRSAC